MASEAVDFSVGIILPASGSGERMKMPCPKQFSLFSGKPLIYFTLSTFNRIKWIQFIIIVVSESYSEWIKDLVKQCDFKKVIVVLGADTRHRSIYNGVKAINEVCDKPDVVLIHDAVRLFAEEELVQKIASSAKLHGAAGVTRPLVSTVISVNPDQFMTESLDRNLYRASEMPQGFKYEVIKTAYEQCTDEDFINGTECLLLAMKYSNVKAHIIEGNSSLWKVTTKKDLYAAEGMLKEKFNCTLLLNIKDTSSLYSSCVNQFTQKNLKVSLLQGDTTFTNSLFRSVIDLSFYKTDGENLFHMCNNVVHSCFNSSQLKTVYLHVLLFNSHDDLINAYSTLFIKYQQYCESQLNKDLMIHHLILANQNKEEELSKMCAEIIWNRSESLSGNILMIS